MAEKVDLKAAVDAFDRDAIAGERVEENRQRQMVLTTFPLDRWPQLPLERYAMGLGQERPPYCTVLEFHTRALGGMKGGSSGKHIMFRHKTGEWRLAAPVRDLEPDAAWTRVRAEFVHAFEAAAAGDLDRIDDLRILSYGPALTTKSLATYFPQHFIPIFSADHLRRFIRLFGHEPTPGARTWRLNRELRSILQERPEVGGWEAREVMRLLYDQFDPRPKQPTWMKVAPGERAAWWDDCLAGGFMAVGWDEVDELSQYESDAELRDALDAALPERTGGHLALARSLLAYRDLQPGDRIVANRGKSEVIAVGTVTEGGYRFDQDRAEGRHLVSVDWDTTYRQTLDSPQNAWQSTFGPVNRKLREALEGGRSATRLAAPAPYGRKPRSPTRSVRCSTRSTAKARSSCSGRREPERPASR
jgi:5-methylcytosine-specific restriction protein B